ncbi:MAG TPA: hypothetical protein PKY99_00045 [Turneriella sp.]|nr:hypothetical protein [Turneriella sp.]
MEKAKAYQVSISKETHEALRAFCSEEGGKMGAVGERFILSGLEKAIEERAKRRERIKAANGGGR